MKKGLTKILLIGGLGILAGSCSNNDYNAQKQEETKPIEYLESSTAYFFKDKGIIAPLERNGSQDGIALAVGDMDSDGDLDILVAKSNYHDPGVRYFENLGGVYADNGIIAPLERNGSQDGIALAVGDMDGDGDLDILVTKSNSGNSGIRYIENNLPQKNKGVK